MAAPSTTARTTPAGIKLRDGYQTLIAFAAAPALSIWEIGIKPPGVDGGAPIDQTTQQNTLWRTSTSRSLITLTPISGTGGYDPNLYNTILSIINHEGSITIHYPDLSTLDFYGYLQKVDFGELKEGERPTVSFEIIPTNYDPVNHVEAAPVLTSVAGT